ncbi:MAG: alpha/beta fold hydrolase [Acidimicrobiales bacterium]
MPRTDSNGVGIEYDTIGDPNDPALLLVMGFATQLTAWDLEFCQLLADRGLNIIRFDNRDCGLSHKTEGDPPNIMTLMMAVTSGQEITVEVPYTLSEMAADGLSVLDHLGIGKAHVVGASMGGMIAQQMAIEHPDRVLSLTSIMSTTGNASVGQGTQEALMALFSPPPDTRDEVIERGVKIGAIVCGPHFDEAEARVRIGQAFDRSYWPQGAPFQIAAIAKTGDRTEGLANLDTPALVIHGEVDSLVALSGGEATAASIPGAELLTFDDMGHDLPKPRWPEITQAIAELTRRET